jgi:hypothetical protein
LRILAEFIHNLPVSVKIGKAGALFMGALTRGASVLVVN